MSVIYISIPWFIPAYKAGGPIQSIANLVEQLAVGPESIREQLAEEQLAVGSLQLANEPYQFKIICSNNDLDGSLLKELEYDHWVRFLNNTEVWYSSSDKITSCLLYTSPSPRD